MYKYSKLNVSKYTTQFILLQYNECLKIISKSLWSCTVGLGNTVLYSFHPYGGITIDNP